MAKVASSFQKAVGSFLSAERRAQRLGCESHGSVVFDEKLSMFENLLLDCELRAAKFSVHVGPGLCHTTNPVLAPLGGESKSPSG